MNPRELASNVCIADDVRLGQRVRLAGFVNLYGCEIGDDTSLGAFVEVQSGVRVGKRCKISSHTFICSGVVVEDEVFIGHGVLFINDRHPRAANGNGEKLKAGDWFEEPSMVRRGASIGTGAIIMCGVEIGENSMIGAGALVTHDVAPNSLVAGQPARMRRVFAVGKRVEDEYQVD